MRHILRRNAIRCIGLARLFVDASINTFRARMAHSDPFRACVVTNALIAFALHKDATIFWWLQALQNRTVKDLHRNWEYGDSFWSSLQSGKRTNRFCVGSVLATLVIVDNILLQRAMTITSVKGCRNITMVSNAALTIPWGLNWVLCRLADESEYSSGALLKLCPGHARLQESRTNLSCRHAMPGDLLRYDTRIWVRSQLLDRSYRMGKRAYGRNISSF